ncbi:MAG: hypothetical protein VKO39_01795 [Cyanobacteriota bacterium]|nr:hypothetical protein [Cyanobacteriota bacterium]
MSAGQRHRCAAGGAWGSGGSPSHRTPTEVSTRLHLRRAQRWGRQAAVDQTGRLGRERWQTPPR